MKTVTPPENLNELDRDSIILFLAGGYGVPWREELKNHLSDLEDLIILDPSVDDWESLGEENIDNDKWVAQVDWEQLGLTIADIRVFHFNAPSECPISLLELGLFKTGGDKSVIVHTDDDYKRASYIKYVTRRFGLYEADTTKSMSELVKIKYYELQSSRSGS